MDKIDFDILLATIPTVNDRRDVALVAGSYATAQQIKNIVLLNRSENSFNYALGTNIQTFLSGNVVDAYLVVDQINTAITYSIQNISKVRTKITKNGNILTIRVKYDYSTKTSSTPNQEVTITMDTNT
jgi:hypothetical protein